MNGIKKYAKVILFDSLAVLCFIGVVLFGWLPGPGGIPLLILGLSFLAVNHDWAERWIETVKYRGKTIKTIIFPNNPAIRHTYDAVATITIGLGLYIAFTSVNRIIIAVGTILVTSSLVVILFNRDRFDKIADLVTRRKHK